MTDPQVAILATAIGAVGSALIATLRWAVSRITKSNDEGTAALVANTASNAVLGSKVDALMASNQRLVDRIDSIGDFVEEHTPIGPPPKQRIATPGRGVRIPRPGTHHDGER